MTLTNVIYSYCLPTTEFSLILLLRQNRSNTFSKPVQSDKNEQAAREHFLKTYSGSQGCDSFQQSYFTTCAKRFWQTNSLKLVPNSCQTPNNTEMDKQL